MILIVSVADDIHAAVIRGKVRERGYRSCHLLASDGLAGHQSLSMTLSNGVNRGCAIVDGEAVDIGEAKVLWLRRPRAKQRLDGAQFDKDSAELINNDCRLGLNALLTTSFAGKWISALAATQQASDKVFQLHVAASCGFRVPATLVSQSKAEVSAFYERHHGEVVVKTLAGVNNAFLLTCKLDDPQSLPEEAFTACPAIYQERIAGSRHIRLNCFGDRSHAALIESSALDWRPDLRVPVSSWPVSAELDRRVVAVLRKLGLEMGIIDLKITPQGEIVWLEVNPQGQFLFLDALTDLNLADKFAEYLIESAAGIP